MEGEEGEHLCSQLLAMCHLINIQKMLIVTVTYISYVILLIKKGNSAC